MVLLLKLLGMMAENVDKFPQFIVRHGMERAFFKHNIFLLHEGMVTKKQLLIKIENVIGHGIQVGNIAC